MSRFDDPFGRGRPRRRLSEEETVQRMLATGSQMVAESGLQLSFDLLRVEDVIARAEVSRSAVYKYWPRKEQFYGDLLLRLAEHALPPDAAYRFGTVYEAVTVVMENPHRLDDARGRRWLVIEICRRGAQQNFDALRASAEWHVYVTLHATLLSLPSTGFQESMQRQLRHAEERFVTAMVTFYVDLANVLGLRIRPGAGDFTFRDFASLGAASIEGVALMSGANASLADRRFVADPFGTGLMEWSQAGVLFASLAAWLLEPDPAEEWDAERVARAKEELNAMLVSAREAMEAL